MRTAKSSTYNIFEKNDGTVVSLHLSVVKKSVLNYFFLLRVNKYCL